MAGLQYLSYCQLGKETVAGTAVPATRQLFPEGTGLLDENINISFNELSNRGTKTRTTTGVSQGYVVGINYRTNADGVAFDEMIFPGSQLRGAQTGVGATADKTWTFTPSQTAASVPESYTIEVGDDAQAFEIEMCYARGFEISASRDSMTQMTIDWFGRQVTKTTKTTVAATSPVRIAGRYWQHKFAAAQASLTAASFTTAELRSFTLNVDTGLRPQFYLDGNTYYGAMSESGGLNGTLNLTVDSVAANVTEYYDKWKANTPSFHRFTANGPTLGATQYQLTFDVCVIYETVEVIGSETDGVNQYEITARLAYDSTWAQSMLMATTNTLAAIP